MVRSRSALYPDIGHTARYLRKMLIGEKPMPIETFDAFLDRVIRRCGREAFRRLINAWLAKYDMTAVDAPARPAAAQVALEEQLLDVAARTGEVISFCDSARRDGFDDDERRKATPLLDRAASSLRQLHEAVSR